MDITVNNNTMVKLYKTAFKEPLDGWQKDGFCIFLDLLRQDHQVTDVRWAAYMLATAKYEVANTWHPIQERGSAMYFIRNYWRNEKKRIALGNLSEKDAILFRGRGYTQITGRHNYTFVGSKIGIDLVSSPQKALDPVIAYQIMSIGMRFGFFTTKRLADYISDAGTDYLNARRVVNGIDKRELIAGYATTFQRILA